MDFDVPSISAIVAAVGVLIGVVIAVVELRNLVKQRKTDLVVRLYSAFTADDFLTALVKVRNLEFEDYRDFVKKYGSITLETPLNLAIYKVANYFDQVGTLLHKRLVDIDMVAEFLTPSTIMMWNKLGPIAEGYRKEMGFKFSRWFEYLYDELKKREQAGVDNG